MRRYEKVEGSDPDNMFSVSAITGEVSLNSRLDYEASETKVRSGTQIESTHWIYSLYTTCKVYSLFQEFMHHSAIMCICMSPQTAKLQVLAIAGERSSQASITVNIEDVNDNSPIFTENVREKEESILVLRLMTYNDKSFQIYC